MPSQSSVSACNWAGAMVKVIAAPDAHVLAAAEGQVVRRPAGDVEAVRVGVLALVAVGRGVEQRDPTALADRDAVDLVVLEHLQRGLARGEVRRSEVAHHGHAELLANH